MRLGTLTALDLSGIRPRRQAGGAYRHPCPACGSAALTGNWHTQCGDPACGAQVFSPLDTVATLFAGDHAQAASYANDQLQRETVTRDQVLGEQIRRRVLDQWLTCCRSEPITAATASQREALRGKGCMLLPGQRGMVVISAATISRLVLLAAETGADFPEVMLQSPPESALAYAVQTTPHTIDRIVITTGATKSWHLVWHRKRVGVVGLIGCADRLLAADYRTALELQRQLSDLGQAAEVAAVFLDREGAAFREPWRPDIHTLTTAVSSAEDVVTFAAFHSAFPLAADCVKAVHSRHAMALDAPPSAVSWSGMRRSYLAAAIGTCERELTGAAASLLERAGPSREEISWLIQRFRSAGRLELAEAVKHHLDNRVIADDGKGKIRETASEYLVDHGHSTATIANFALQFSSNLFFRDSVDVFHAARLVFGRTSLDVAIAAHALDNPGELQKTLRHQVLLTRKTAPDVLPTVIDLAAMRRHIVPHFKRQVASLPSQEGFCSLGWTNDRSLFVGPGVRVTLDGRVAGPVPRHPAISELRHFDTTGNWDVGFSGALPAAARDLVAMILASCVRFFVKSVTRPVSVRHSPESRHLLETMFEAVGQRGIYELNPNMREGGNAAGARGYPLLTTGYNAAQAQNAKFGHVLLTDHGYGVAAEVSQEDAEAAGRSLQFGLLRIVEWCLATEAKEFSEVPALNFNSSLLREGKWLVENVCELQPWEVSDLGATHLEQILAQIPAADTAKRLTLLDGTTLLADLSGIVWDRALLAADLSALKSRCGGEDNVVEMAAVEVLPALGLYYGSQPDVAVASH